MPNIILKMKKSQMQMNETILVLFIFFMIIVFGLIFYSRIQNVVFERQKKALENLEVIEVSKLLKSLPELSCSTDNVLEDNCYNIIKIETFKNVLKDKKDYFSNTPLYNTNITVYQYDPFNNKWTNTWQIYDNPLENADQRKAYVPLSLYDPMTKTNSFGILIITLYKK